MVCDDAFIRERLEYLKRVTYEELNTLRLMILSEKNYKTDDEAGYENSRSAACKNGAEGSRTAGDTYAIHKKAFKRTCIYTDYRKFKK